MSTRPLALVFGGSRGIGAACVADIRDAAAVARVQGQVVQPSGGMV